MRDGIRHTTVLAGWLLAAGMAGCSAQPVQIAGAESARPADDGSPGYLDRISSQPEVSENDALRGMLMLLDGDDKAKTFQARVEALGGRGIVSRTWRHDADRALTKGRLAYMVCRACEIRGGVIMLLTGPSQRYCLRELQYMDMMSPGTPAATVTGMEFVAVISRADTYRRTGEIPAIMEVTSGGL